MERERQHLTQEYVSSKCDCNMSHISNVERGAKVSLTALVDICNVLGVTMDYMLADNLESENALDDELLKEFHSCSKETKE